MCLFTKDFLVSIATSGCDKLFSALKKHFNDTQIIHEIYDRADKLLFLVAASDHNYLYIADIKEYNIFDVFIDECYSQQVLDIDVDHFVKQYYTHKSQKAQKYITSFFTDLSHIIYDVLKEKASSDTRIILKGQNLSVEKILGKLDIIGKDISTLINKSKPKTIVVKYCANMQNQSWNLSDITATLSDKYVDREIELSLINATVMPNNSQNYWDTERNALTENFKKKVVPFFDDYCSFSVYAIAPIPLLILLGHLFANKPNIEIYQLHKTPSTWTWKIADTSLAINRIWHSKNKQIEEAILILSFSGKVNLNEVISSVNFCEGPIVELSIETPYDDFLQSKTQLDEFIISYRKVKEELKNNGAKKIHLFSAIPISFAISIGQVYNPNYDADLVTYDYKQGRYTKAFSIGEDI